MEVLDTYQQIEFLSKVKEVNEFRDKAKAIALALQILPSSSELVSKNNIVIPESVAAKIKDYVMSEKEGIRHNVFDPVRLLLRATLAKQFNECKALAAKQEAEEEKEKEKEKEKDKEKDKEKSKRRKSSDREKDKEKEKEKEKVPMLRLGALGALSPLAERSERSGRKSERGHEKVVPNNYGGNLDHTGVSSTFPRPSIDTSPSVMHIRFASAFSFSSSTSTSPSFPFSPIGFFNLFTSSLSSLSNSESEKSGVKDVSLLHSKIAKSPLAAASPTSASLTYEEARKSRELLSWQGVVIFNVRILHLLSSSSPPPPPPPCISYDLCQLIAGENLVDNEFANTCDAFARVRVFAVLASSYLLLLLLHLLLLLILSLATNRPDFSGVPNGCAPTDIESAVGDGMSNECRRLRLWTDRPPD